MGNNGLFTPSTKEYYVPQLDGLRFWAFLLVFFHHLPSAARAFPSWPFVSDILETLKRFGWMGVDLFLVLSAFLITTLLLIERNSEGRISLKDFYIRRSLRIWPLYYFMLFLGFFIFPAFGLFQGVAENGSQFDLIGTYLIPHLTFLGNYSSGLFGYVPSPALAHLWTISLEEQFYILWPAMLVFLIGNQRWLVVTFILFLGFTLLIRLYFVLGPFNHPMLWTNLFSRLDPFVLGSGLAFYRVNMSNSGRFSSVKTILGLLIIIAVTRFPDMQTQSMHAIWQFLAIACGFTLLLDAAMFSNGHIVRFFIASPLIVKLGKLGYGLYVYHLLGIYIAEFVVSNSKITNPSWAWFSLLFLGLFVTILLAWVSYQWIEKPFLQLKSRFTHVKSRSIKL